MVNCYLTKGHFITVEKIDSFIDDDKSEFVGAMDMDWKDREKSEDQDS